MVVERAIHNIPTVDLGGPTRPPSDVFLDNWGHIPQTPCQRGSSPSGLPLTVPDG